MAHVRGVLFGVEPRWVLCLILLLAVVVVTLQDGNESCYVLQDSEVPIGECDPFVYIVGDILHLPCHNFSLHHTQDAVSVEWFKDGQPLNNYRGFNLTKSNLQISDSGDYLCLVGSQHRFSHKVMVGREPSQEPPTPRCTSRYIGTYNCSWSKNHMPSTNLPTRFQLKFCEERPGHACEYFNASPEGGPVTVTVNATKARFFISLCVANCLGQAVSGSFMVAPELTFIPPPPRDVHMFPISVNQMNVSFEPSLLLDERIEYIYMFTQERTSFAVWEKAVTSHTISSTFTLEVANGKPFSEVCIKIAAYYKHRDKMEISEYTTPVCSYTQMAAPSAGPPHFTSCSEPDNLQPDVRKVNFTWEHLNPDEANGIIIKYTLILSVTSSTNQPINSSKEVFIIPPDHLFFLAEGVRSQCEYRAELYAENEVGRSPPSVNTVLMASEAEVFSIKLLLILSFLLSFGFLIAGIRLLFCIKKRVLPKIPEPSFNSQLLHMKMESLSGIIEKEVFDELNCKGVETTKTISHSTSDSGGYFEDEGLTQSLLEPESRNYVEKSPAQHRVSTRNYVDNSPQHKVSTRNYVDNSPQHKVATGNYVDNSPQHRVSTIPQVPQHRVSTRNYVVDNSPRHRVSTILHTPQHKVSTIPQIPQHRVSTGNYVVDDSPQHKVPTVPHVPQHKVRTIPQAPQHRVSTIPQAPQPALAASHYLSHQLPLAAPQKSYVAAKGLKAPVLQTTVLENGRDCAYVKDDCVCGPVTAVNTGGYVSR